MRRIVVPLDGSTFATAILPDARRLAGPNGELILVNDVDLFPYWDIAHVRQQRATVDASREYLKGVADRLRAEDVKVETQTMITDNVARAIDEAAMIFDADMVAVATHGLSPLGRLQRGSIAWQALAHSPVPVLIRHVNEAGGEPIQAVAISLRQICTISWSPARPGNCRLRNHVAMATRLSLGVRSGCMLTW